MNHRSSLVAVVTACVLSHRAPAQSRPSRADAVGIWRGTSRCLVRPSPCHDEVVVYRIVGVSTSDGLSVDARKIVNAKEEEMGVLACRLAAASARVTCTMPNGVWRFTVRGDSLVGELRLPDGTKFRDVRTARSP